MLSKAPRRPAAARPSPRAAAPRSPLQSRADASAPVAALQALQRRADGTNHPVQRIEDEELMMMKANPAAPEPASAGPLPQPLRSGVEALSGVALDDVRVHRNSSRPAAVAAHAYTQGTDIHVAPGQERHLAHEAWHAVQQATGRVRPTGGIGGTAINDDPSLEREADVMGDRAAQLARNRELG